MPQLVFPDKARLASSIFLSILFLLLCSALIEILELDRVFADYLYQLQGNQWRFKDAWLTETIVHKGGKYLSIVSALLVLFAWIVSLRTSRFSLWRNTLGFLFVSTVLGALLVSVGKAISYVSCPWDFSRYGGTLEYLPLMDQLIIRNGSQCFPAGHASAGYAWVALYFVGLHMRSTWRLLGLMVPLLIGLIFGFSQQLRGAHFISHDLWSFGVCWMVSLTCYHLMLKPYESFR